MIQPLSLLEGITVVSLEQYISAPYCTQILADAGATVIKVERPPNGDPRRGYDPVLQVGEHSVSGGFASYNRGKESVTLDFSDEFDQVAFRNLLETADVLVSNLRPGALERAGLSLAEITQRYPSMIVCEITGFGTTGGPSESWPAFDSVIQAMSGMSSLIGASGADAPLLAPMGTMDILSGTWAALGILLALVGRARTGEGTHVDAAMLDIGAAFLERPLSLFEFSGIVQTRGADAFSPVGAFRAADGAWLSIVIPTDAMWARCCTTLGMPELIRDPSLDSVLLRARAMQSKIVPLLEAWARRHSLDAEQVAARFRENGQPVGIVNTIAEVRASPQLAHRELFAPLIVQSGGELVETNVKLPTLPLLFNGARPQTGSLPELGAHSERVAERLRGREEEW